jgi:hypothetical protein
MATKTWKGGGTTANPKSGNWGTSANWSPAGVPAAGDHVVIDGSGAYTVTLNGNTAALNALTINNSAATLVIATFTLHESGTGVSAINVQAGQITIAGGTVNDAGGMTLASGTGVSGAGTLKISGHYTGAGLLQASGGTLDVFGTIDSGIALQIASASASILKIEGKGTAVAAVAISSANQTLEVGASGNLTINAVESISNGTIQLIGGTLTAASGIAIGSGAVLTGKGTVAAPVLGAGTVRASGGTLDLTGPVSTGLALTIDTTAGSDLKIDGTAAAASAIAISSANQTLEIGANGSLTISAAESLTKGKIKLDGGTLTDAAGLTIGSGALLTGKRTVAAPLSGSGTIRASGGTLDLIGTVSSGPLLRIDTTAGSNLKIDGVATAAGAVPIKQCQSNPGDWRDWQSDDPTTRSVTPGTAPRTITPPPSAPARPMR